MTFFFMSPCLQVSGGNRVFESMVSLTPECGSRISLDFLSFLSTKGF